MANKRLFSKLVCSTDAYFSLSLGAQALFVQLQLEADDFGFIATPKRIMRGCMRKDEDLRELIDHGYLIEFPATGHVVLTHWFIANRLYNDCKPLDEMEYRCLALHEDKSYFLHSGNLREPPGDSGLSSVSDSVPATALSESLSSPSFAGPERPTRDEIAAEVERAGLSVDAAQFLADCEADGWKDGKGESVRDWKKWLRGYAALKRASGPPQNGKTPTALRFDQREYTEAELRASTARNMQDIMDEARTQGGGDVP